MFLFWIIKNELNCNFSYFIVKYMIDCGNKVDITFLPYGMVFTQTFAKYNLNLNDKNQTIPLINSPQLACCIKTKEKEKKGKRIRRYEKYDLNK